MLRGLGDSCWYVLAGGKHVTGAIAIGPLIANFIDRIGVTYPLTKGLVGKVEYASFREDDVLTPAVARKRDTGKLWLTLVYNFE